MKDLLKLEELCFFLGSLWAFSTLPYSWWWFFGLLLLPDIGAAGYLINNRIGAWTYNILHHRGIAVLLYLSGIYFNNIYLELAGIILFAHIALDRSFGFGLKYEKGFKYTHLGELGKDN